MHEDLSVFKDETLVLLLRDLCDQHSDGVGTPRTLRLLKVICLEIASRGIEFILNERFPGLLQVAKAVCGLVRGKQHPEVGHDY